MLFNQGYFITPHLRGDTIVFSSDDDLWSASLKQAQAIRVTSGQDRAIQPKISPDGTQIAFLGREGGSPDVYLVPLDSGPVKRITWLGIDAVLGWLNDKEVLFASSHKAPNRGMGEIYAVNIETYSIELLPTGPANQISFSPDGKKLLIGRNCRDSARWKRYQGGTAGKFWIQDDSGTFKPLLPEIIHNITCPHWHKDNCIYFISDHEGYGNIYRCNPDGSNLKRMTHHDEFYARNLSSDGERFIYHCGGDLFLFDPESQKNSKINISIASGWIQSQPQFKNAGNHLEHFALSSDGNTLAITSRGRLFKAHPWLKGSAILGKTDEVRYHNPVLLKDGNVIAACHSSNSEEEIILFKADGNSESITPDSQWGKIWNLHLSPDENQIAVCTNRYQIWIVDLKTKERFCVAKKDAYRSASWSPDSRYLAFTLMMDQDHRTGIHLYDMESKSAELLIEPVLSDYNPVFSDDGEYLFFNSIREFQPTYSQTHFQLGFPFAGRPFALSLKKDTPSPFDAHYSIESEPKSKKEKKSIKVEIHKENLEQRIFPFPLELGGYSSLSFCNGKLFYLKSSVKPLKKRNAIGSKPCITSLYGFDFKEKKSQCWQKSVPSYVCAGNRILLQHKGKLRILDTGAPPKETGSACNPKDGWVDLARFVLRVNPVSEWKQMYEEAWLLQKEHFWTEDMSQVDWTAIYLRYLPLLERVHTRAELSDLLWEMQGELGTSHCYEIAGDYYRTSPVKGIGRLGAEFLWKEKSKSLAITDIYQGDCWIDDGTSPLCGTQANLKPKDEILGFDGQLFSSYEHAMELLENKPNKWIQLTVKRKGSKKLETISVKTLSSHKEILYRQWINSNKEKVHKLSGGKLGYIHVPNMGADGYAEFFRHFLSEKCRTGLIVDVRYNGGGHVSQHLLSTLSLKVLGYTETRWTGHSIYPATAVPGPVIALTNEHAGSDGDIFSHAFKLAKIGPLVGKRTWGGVIGINGQYSLKDGTVTTQPEYSFWFNDVGYAVENYGTEPDIEVEYPPESWLEHTDPQLKIAVDTALKALKENPVKIPDLKTRPNLGVKSLL